MDNPSYVIEIGRGHPRAKEFARWLKARGHELDRATSTKSYVDGEAIDRNEEARRIFMKLYKQFEKESQDV
jgi:hypothetical protein